MGVPGWFVRRWAHCALRPRHAGIYSYRPGDAPREPRPRRDHWEVYIVLAGSVTVRWYDHDHLADAGDAYLTPPGIAWQDDLGRRATGWRLFNCGFDLVEAAWPNPLRDLALPRVVHLDAAEALPSRCQDIVALTTRRDDDLAATVRLRALLDSVLVEIIATGFAQGAFPVDASAAPAWLQAARDELLRRLQQPDLDLHDLVAASGCSPSYFAHAFSRHFRLPPMRYLRHERMALAARLLRGHRDTAVRDIARRSGYRDANLFARHFRAQFGCTPTQWRLASAPEP